MYPILDTRVECKYIFDEHDISGSNRFEYHQIGM